MKKVSNFLVIIGLLVTSLFSLTGEEIMEKIDKNRIYKSIEFVATMEIHTGKRVRIKKMRAISVGDKKSFTEFLNLEDKGTKYLKLDKELWIYFPEEDDTVKISGHLLKKGMMGSDVSYEDALESDRLSDKYSIELKSEESYDGHDCYIVALTAKVKNASYFKRLVWVDKKMFVVRKEERYAKSGKLLKTVTVSDFKHINGLDYAVKTVIQNELKKGNKTIFVIDSVKFDMAVDPALFSLRYLIR